MYGTLLGCIRDREFIEWDYGDWKTPIKEYDWTTKPGYIR